MEIQFDEATHTYSVGDTRYISVTTFKALFFDKFDSSATIDRMMASPKWTSSKYFGKSKAEITKEWDDAGLESRQEGTRLHKSIELYYNGTPVEDPSKEYSQFLAFAREMPLKPFRAEWTVFHPDYALAGTIDMVFERPDGVVEIFDWKRTKALVKTGFRFAKPPIEHLPDTNYWQYAVQLNLYRFILETKYNKTVGAMYLVCFHPTLDAFQKEEVCRLPMEDLLKSTLPRESTGTSCPHTNTTPAFQPPSTMCPALL